MANFMGAMQDPTDEKSAFEKFWRAVQDVTTGFLYYTAENVTIADYDVYTPLGANAKLNRLLFIPDEVKEEMLEMKDLNKYITMFNSTEHLKNWFYYGMPIFKNYKIALLPEYDGFKDDLHNFVRGNA